MDSRHQKVFERYKEKDFTTCLQLIAEASAEIRESTHYKMLKATCLVNLWKMSEAHKIYDEILEDDEGNATAHCCKAFAYNRCRQINLSKSSVDKAMSIMLENGCKIDGEGVEGGVANKKRARDGNKSSDDKPAKVSRVERVEEQVVELPELCEEVLEEIFSNLNAKDLKNSALVCKNWNEVIGSSAVTMEKFELKLEDFDESFRSSRKHQNISVTDVDNPLIVLEFASSMKCFEFLMSGKIIDGANLVKFLKFLSLMPLLDELHIDFKLLSEAKGQKVVNLPNLKKFVAESDDAAIFDLITCSDLIDLDYEHENKDAPGINTQSLVRFLERSKKLKRLRLGSDDLNDFLKSNDPQSTEWKLSYLSVILKRQPSEAFISNFMKFLISQATTLTSLRFEHFGRLSFEFPKDFFEKIFSRLTKLTSLYEYWDDNFFENHGKSLRNLAALDWLRVVDMNDINSIARFHPKLNFLSIDSLHNPLESGLKLNNLTELGVAFLGGADVENWLSLIKGCPKLETFMFGHFLFEKGKEVGDYSDAIEVLIRHPNIRHLEFSSDEVRNFGKVFKKVCRNYGNLKSFRFGLFNIKSIKFLLPEDPSQWKFAEERKRLQFL